MKSLYLVVFQLFIACALFAQGLENVVVETYYVSDSNDATDTDGGSLAEGSITYRVFIDLAEGWELQAVYGNEDHELRIETSTLFFNNEDRGEETGDVLPDNRLDENTVALDSYVTLGAASDEHLAVLKSLDPDGSIIGGANNDGGSESIPEGLLANDDALAGIPLTTADGLVEGTLPSGVISVGLDLSVFGDVNDGPIFSANGGAYSVLEGVQGPTADNHVLVAQITTDGEFSFCLNIQVGEVATGITEQYVCSDPIGDEIYFGALNYPALGCTSETACNYNQDAAEDDGTCIEPVENCSECNADNNGLDIIDTDGDGICDGEEIAGCSTSETACNYNPDATDEEECLEPIENCLECNVDGTMLVLVDTDGDGVCDAEEIDGCTSETACNYDPLATEDDGSCNEPEENCFECDGDDLVIIDSDGDGICDALENPGCNSETACNYDPEATSDDGSCIEPVENCSECNMNNDGLDIIDTDGDGICDADELAGCSSETACNYDPEATDDDGSCLEPEENCTECDGEMLVLIDSDGDGICDEEEIAGCTSDTACNYNPEATDDDGSCNEPVEDCFECDGEDLVIIDTDGDGVCDGEEIFGCTDPLALNYNPEATEDDGSCIYTNIEEIQLDVDITIYPNPVDDQVFLSIGSNRPLNLSCDVMNIIGETVKSEVLGYTSQEQTFRLDMSGLSSGVYLVRISDNSEFTYTSKVTKR